MLSQSLEERKEEKEKEKTNEKKGTRIKGDPGRQKEKGVNN